MNDSTTTWCSAASPGAAQAAGLPLGRPGESASPAAGVSSDGEGGAGGGEALTRRGAPAGPSWAARWAYLFYAVAAAGAAVGQVWVAVAHVPWPAEWPVAARLALALPFAACLELLGMVTSALADERMRLGERALALRCFSAGVATVAVSVIVIGHWPHAYLVVGFGALSTTAYLLWTLHAAARRRDALRARGLLSAVAPVYGPGRWLPLVGRPGWRVTRRARELAVAHGLGLHESLQAARQQLRAEQRRPAIAAAVRRVVRAEHTDPRLADIAVQTLDHDRIAEELERRADYAGWARRLSAAVSAHRPEAGHDADAGVRTPVERADSTADAEADTAPDRTGIPGYEPDMGRAVSGELPAGGRRRASAADVVQATRRTPRPTQAQVAHEFGISERTVRRMLRRSLREC